MDLLKKLTEAYGAPGFEKNIRSILKEEIQSSSAQEVRDDMGSIFGEKKGTSDRPKILLAGHMDEVAFMISEITKEGFLRFAPLGGWWSQVMLSQRVKIITDQKEFTGVIGSKPPHILTVDEMKKVYPQKEMFIDIGAKSNDMVKEWGIRVGDPVVPICPFEILPDGDTILAKALDNRAGCYMAMEVLKGLKNKNHPNTVYAGATVQEEVGLRGAKTAPYIMEPDIAIAMDVGVAQDTPGGNTNKAALGRGPLITFLDSSMIPNVKFRNLVIDTAEKHNIPYQIDVMLGGGTDAGEFHLHGNGIPTVVIGVASRYIHSHTSMISKKDLENSIQLINALIEQLDETTVNGIKND